MTENTRFPLDFEEIVRSLPPRRERADVASMHPDYIDMCVGDFRQMVAMNRPCRRRLADLTVSLTRNLKDGFANVAKWVDSLIPDFDIAPVPNYACATRALGDGGSCEAPAKMSFEKPGDGCSLGIDLEVTSFGANVKVRLLNDEGNAILPFSLTVRDADSGASLLKDREFTSGAAKLNGVERGKYELLASGNGVNCDFSMVVE